jgi:hypothetical protein
VEPRIAIMPPIYPGSLALVCLVGLAFAHVSVADAQALTFAGHGVRGGPSISRFQGVFGDGMPERRRGITGAWFVRWQAGRLLSLQPELAWVARGGDGGIAFDAPLAFPPAEPYPVRYGYYIYYLEMPLLLRLDVPTREAWGLYVVGGPALALLMNSGARYGRTPVAITTAEREWAEYVDELGLDGFSADFRSTDVSIVGGGGLVLGRGNVRGVIDARYTHGLTNVLPVDVIDARHRSWSVTAGIELR